MCLGMDCVSVSVILGLGFGTINKERQSRDHALKNMRIKTIVSVNQRRKQ
jgi:hypothetical protein